MDTWSQVDLRSSDITAIQLHTVRGKLLIINMYNEGHQQQGMKQVTQSLRARAWCDNTGTSDRHIIWVSDFNLHHPMWDKGRNSHLFMGENLEKSQRLIDAIAEFDLQMALLKDIPTLHALSLGNYMRPNNIFTSSLLINDIILCGTPPNECPARSDHILLATHLKTKSIGRWRPPDPTSRRPTGRKSERSCH